MATLPRPKKAAPERLELHSGDRMSREEFHRIYERMPEDFKAELIGGIVYVASPLRRPHGTVHTALNGLLFIYAANTPGTEAADNATIILSDDAEPQPDLLLRILPERGGQSQDTPDEYIAGPPEFLAEIAHSSRAIDLHAKRRDYARYGVLEYLVLCLGEEELRWFDLRTDKELQPDSDGVYRVRTFPGLWIHREALLAKDYKRTIAVLEQGLATPEHAAFVARLAAAHNEPR